MPDDKSAAKAAEKPEARSPYAVTNHAIGARGFTAGPKGADQIIVPPHATVEVQLTDAEFDRYSKHPDLRLGLVEKDEGGAVKPVVKG